MTRPTAIKILKPFILRMLGMEICVEKMKHFYNKMIFIQKKLIDKLESRAAKIEVMLTYWDKLYGKLQIKCTDRGDKKGNILLSKICTVPREVKYAILKKYITKCAELHAVAFF